MAKAKIVITSTIEFDINPKHYPTGLTPEECLKIEIKNAQDDPWTFLDMDNADFTITGEIISK